MFGQSRQYRRQVDNDLAEQIESDRADILNVRRLGRVFSQLPRLVVLDVRIRLIGQAHDQPHGFAVVGRFVGLANFVAEFGTGGKQAAIVRVFCRQPGRFDKLRAAAREVDDFVHEVGVHLRDELVDRQIQVFNARREFRRVEISQVAWIEMLEVGARANERALALRHLFAIDGEEAVDVDFRRQTVAGGLEHAGPEQRVEVRDVFADEMVNLAIFRAPPIVEFLACAIAPLLRRGHVADRRVEPHVPIVAGAVGNFEAEIRGRARDVPIAERLAEEMALQVVGDLGLQVLARLRPLFQETVQLFEFDEQVRRLAQLRRRAAQRAARIDELGRAVVVAAAAAVVAGLIGRAAFGALAAHEAIGQERADLRIEELLDVALLDQAGFANRLPDLLAERPVLGAVRAAVVVELDIERGEVALVRLAASRR